MIVLEKLIWISFAGATAYALFTLAEKTGIGFMPSAAVGAAWFTLTVAVGAIEF